MYFAYLFVLIVVFLLWMESLELLNLASFPQSRKLVDGQLKIELRKTFLLRALEATNFYVCKPALLIHKSALAKQ